MPVTDEQLKAMGLDPDVPAPVVKMGAPDMSSAPIPGAAPVMPQYVAPTHEEGKAMYAQMMPKISAAPGTADYFRQRQEQLDFKQAHPWGAPISPHPGIAGKILHGLATAGNIAGDVFAPAAMALIPGTQLHNNMLEGQNMRGITEGTENAEREAQTENLEAQPEIKESKLALDREKQNETEEKNKNDLAQKYRKLGLKYDPVTGQAAPLPYEELSPEEQAVHDLKTNQADAAEARAELDKLKGDPNSQLYQLQLKRLQVATQNAQNAQRRLGLSEQQFANKINEQELVKPSGQAQSRGSAAQAALDVLPDLQNEIRANAEELGPIFGRLQRGEIKIGDVDPKIQKLYSTMQSFYAMQPAVHGFRNAEFVKDFDSFVGGLQTNPEATLAGLEGLKPTLDAVAKEGKTYHKRIVEGKDNTGGGASKTLPMSAIEQAAKDHGISVAEAKKQAESQGYTVK
jgi:hypothetical protein